ncbi:phosphotransferase [Marinicellulosiphila megalodicopiae]|uniref:phosphotransferase n=1 Tax=Marinicellulosiphila megalodicopiae TaxID=2724896 RepID=UPI003BAE3768
MLELSGGREDAIYLSENQVHRPLNPWSSSMHKLLIYLHENGFTQCPKFIRTESNQEILSFIEGGSYNYPLVGEIASLEVLISAAKTLKAFHEQSAKFIQSTQVESLPWMLDLQSPIEVVCHGDFAPYNVAIKNNQVTGIFDFDTCHPAPKLWDIAYAVYCWAPFKTKTDDALGTLNEQIHRAKVFCDAYDLSQKERVELVTMMIKRLEALVKFMINQADLQDIQFQRNIQDEHHLSYLSDIEYLKLHADLIRKGILTN